MNKEVLDMSNNKYHTLMGFDDIDRDENGFMKLIPTAAKVDKESAELTTDITSLEDKLKAYRKKHESLEKYKETDNYRDSKKKGGKKKQKKAKQQLLAMVFNNAEAPDDEDPVEDADDVKVGDLKKKKSKESAKKAPSTKLDTVYGQRFSPVVSMLYDQVQEFGGIADEIRADLDSRAAGKTMYRSSQYGNLISAKNSQLSAIKELASVAKTVTDIEYKKAKDDNAAEGGNNNKAIAALGAKYLQFGSIFDDDEPKKKKDKDRSTSKADRKKKRMEDDDDDDDSMSIEHKKAQNELAEEFAKTIAEKRGKITLSAHERYIDVEGKYKFVVVADPINPDNDWKFVAVNPTTGKEIKDFKEDYKELYPNRKKCRMSFDLAKLKCTDRNTAKSYKLILKD